VGRVYLGYLLLSNIVAEPAPTENVATVKYEYN